MHEGRMGLVYARVSSKKQETEGSGLQSQEGRCREKLRALGVQYTHSFLDSYSGGGDFMQRPAMRELLAFVDANPHKKFIVVFDDLKRFARDTKWHLELRLAFRKRDIIPVCLNFNFEDTPEGEFVELILAGQAELERKQNARQVVQKMKARLELGYWAFARKRGYNMVKDSAHGKIAVPNGDAEIIRTALEGFASGKFMTQTDVARYLVSEGFWGTQARREACLTRTKALLEDSFYAGFVEHKPWGVEPLIGRHEGIISPTTHQLIKTRLKRPIASVRERRDISPDFPLRGLLVCRCCGEKLTGAWAKRKYRYYYCYNRDCALRNDSLSVLAVEDAFTATLERNALKGKAEPLIKLAFERVWKEEIQSLEQQEQVLARRRSELQQKLGKLVEAASRAASDSLRQMYEAQMERVSDELTDTELRGGKTDYSVPFQTSFTKTMELLKKPSLAWESVDVYEKHRLFFLLFETRLAYDKQTGFQTADSLSTTKLFEEITAPNSINVDRTGFEPATPSLQMRCSTN